MISLQTTEGGVKFVFSNSDHYLYGNGTIEVPLNSLALVTDESDMFTFKKAATNDPFISAKYSDIGMTKEELETFYNENMVGGGGIDPEEVQALIDASISGNVKSVKSYSIHSTSGDSIGLLVRNVDGSSAYTNVFTTRNGSKLRCTGNLDELHLEESFVSGIVTSAIYDSSGKTIELKNESGVTVSTIDATDFIKDGMLDSASVEDVVISGETVQCLVLTFNTESGKEPINIPLSELFDPSLLQCDEKTFTECEYNQLWSNPDGLIGMNALDPYDESTWNKKFIFKPNFEGFGGKFMYVGFNFDRNDSVYVSTQHGICPSLYGLISRVLIERDDEHYEQIKDIRVEFPINYYLASAVQQGAPINLTANVLDDNKSIEINISYNPNYSGEVCEWDEEQQQEVCHTEELFDENYYGIRVDVGFLDEWDEETGEPIEYDIEDDSCTSGECNTCLAEHWKYYPQGDRSCKLYDTFKTLPQESVTDRISRIEDAMISRQFTPLFEYTVEENGTIYGNGKSQNPLSDDEDCTFVKTPLFNIDNKSIKWEDGRLIAPEKKFIDIDGLNEHGHQDGAISTTGAQSLVNIGYRIIYFKLENGCANRISFNFEGGNVEYGYISIMFDYNVVYGDIYLTNGHSYQITSDNLVKKGNEYAIDLGIDNDYDVSTNASVNLKAWHCEDSFVGDIKLYRTDYNPDQIYTTTKKMLDATNLNLSTLENAVDEKEEVISRTFYQINDEISGLTNALSGKQDTLIAGSGITISGNVISANGGGGLDEDFLQANANALYELKLEGKATNERFDNYYTKAASDGKYASNASIKKAYYDKAYVDDKLLAISALQINNN